MNGDATEAAHTNGVHVDLASHGRDDESSLQSPEKKKKKKKERRDVPPVEHVNGVHSLASLSPTKTKQVPAEIVNGLTLTNPGVENAMQSPEKTKKKKHHEHEEGREQRKKHKHKHKHIKSELTL